MTATKRCVGLFLDHDVMMTLVQNAVESTFYVSGGKVLARDMAERFGVPLQEAQERIAKVASKLVDHIRELS